MLKKRQFFGKNSNILYQTVKCPNRKSIPYRLFSEMPYQKEVKDPQTLILQWEKSLKRGKVLKDHPWKRWTA